MYKTTLFAVSCGVWRVTGSFPHSIPSVFGPVLLKCSVWLLKGLREESGSAWNSRDGSLYPFWVHLDLVLKVSKRVECIWHQRWARAKLHSISLSCWTQQCKRWMVRKNSVLTQYVQRTMCIIGSCMTALRACLFACLLACLPACLPASLTSPYLTLFHQQREEHLPLDGRMKASFSARKTFFRDTVEGISHPKLHKATAGASKAASSTGFCESEDAAKFKPWPWSPTWVWHRLDLRPGLGNQEALMHAGVCGDASAQRKEERARSGSEPSEINGGSSG